MADLGRDGRVFAGFCRFLRSFGLFFGKKFKKGVDFVEKVRYNGES